jgi:hypothetical protein
MTSYRYQLGRRCDQHEGCSNDVEVYRPNAGRVKNWPFPRFSTSAAEISRQQTSFQIDAVSTYHPEQFPAQRQRGK